jgi:predicted component of viral defense system (DUF524 family)
MLIPGVDQSRYDPTANDVVSQLLRQGASSCDGTVCVPSDSVLYLYFEDLSIPDWVMSSPFLTQRQSLPIFELNLVNRVGRISLGPIELDVESKKLTAEEFWRLLDEVADYVFRLPFSHRGAGSSFELLHKADPSVCYHAFVYTSNLLRSNQLQAAIMQIVVAAHGAFAKRRQYVRVEHARRVDSMTVRDICSNPRYFEPLALGSHLSKNALSMRLKGKYLAGHFPGSILSSEMICIVDNPENQFVRYVLESVVLAVELVKASVGFTSELHREASWIQEQVRKLLSYDLFRQVSMPRQINLASQVLQRRAGYREMLRFHSEMNLPPMPTWSRDLQRILELKDAATLYEYWVFVQICKIVEQVLNASIVKTSLVEHNPLEVALASGIRIEFPGNVEMGYNIQLQGYSGSLRPDVILTTPNGMWVFDAKFRLDRNGAHDSAKTDDVHKMHTYRDALVGCRGAYVVYPGDEVVMYSVDRREGAASIVARDGVGVIPARTSTDLSILHKAILALFSWDEE